MYMRVKLWFHVCVPVCLFVYACNVKTHSYVEFLCTELECA